jgi:hypothetical protein
VNTGVAVAVISAGRREHPLLPVVSPREQRRYLPCPCFPYRDGCPCSAAVWPANPPRLEGGQPMPHRQPTVNRWPPVVRCWPAGPTPDGPIAKHLCEN